MSELTTELYVSGTGQELEVHERTQDCLDHGCCIHNPSDHHMRGWATHWRSDRRLMERICEHGVGHPDPDAMGFYLWMCDERGIKIDLSRVIHGCDGCCRERA